MGEGLLLHYRQTSCLLVFLSHLILTTTDYQVISSKVVHYLLLGLRAYISVSIIEL